MPCENVLSPVFENDINKRQIQQGGEWQNRHRYTFAYELDYGGR